MGKLKESLLLVFLTVFLNIKSQDIEYVRVEGVVMTSELKQISFATIISENTGLGTISSDMGKFAINVNIEDTLKFSSIGYKAKDVPVKEFVKGMNYIFLDSETYKLEEVKIIGFTKWQEFKQEFTAKELKPMEQKVLVIKGLPNPYMILVPNNSLSTNPITMIYQLFNKKAVIERKQKRWNKTYNKTWQNTGK